MEKSLTLDFCLILSEELLKQAKKADERLEVILTREKDENLSGAKRAGLAYEKRAKLFLCFHFNGLKETSIRGTETYYRAPENGNLNLEADVAFAKHVQGALFGAMAALDSKARDRGVKPDTKSGKKKLGVLNDTFLGNDKRKDMCSAAYIEAEFITNPAVDRLLVSGPHAIANRTRVMAPVAQAIRAHMRAML